MSDAKDKPKEGEAEAKPKSKKKLIIIIVVVLLLVGGGAGFFLMKGSGGEEEGAEQQEEETHARVLKRIALDTIIVNLSEAKSFLKVSMLLEYDPEVLLKVAAHGAGEGHGGGGSGGGEGEGEGGFPPEMMEREPIVKDSIIRVLSSRTPGELLTVAGKQSLKDELIEAINEALEFTEPVITNIYFTEFIIQ